MDEDQSAQPGTPIPPLPTSTPNQVASDRIVPPLAPSTPTQNVPNTKRGVPVLIITLLFIVGLALLSFWTYQNYFAPQQAKKEVATPAPTPILTLNWEVYTNTKYGYSISHPPTWNVNSVAYNLNGIPPGDCYDQEKYPEFIEISSKENRSNCSGVDYIASDQAEIIIFSFKKADYPNFGYLFTGSEKVDIAGEVGVKKIFDKNTERPAPMATTIAFSHNGQSYIIYIQQPEEGLAYDTSLDQILSTFKFTQ